MQDSFQSSSPLQGWPTIQGWSWKTDQNLPSMWNELITHLSHTAGTEYINAKSSCGSRIDVVSGPFLYGIFAGIPWGRLLAAFMLSVMDAAIFLLCWTEAVFFRLGKWYPSLANSVSLYPAEAISATWTPDSNPEAKSDIRILFRELSRASSSCRACNLCWMPRFLFLDGPASSMWATGLDARCVGICLWAGSVCRHGHSINIVQSSLIKLPQVKLHM